MEQKSRELAEKFFHAPPAMFNCAQSVAAACGREDMCEAMGACGGGRAPEGLCGALFAALSIAPDDKYVEICSEFQKAVGALKCREIKAEAKTPCMDCVAKGIELCLKEL